MSVLKIEQMPLPSELEIKISRPKAALQLIFGFFLIPLGGFTTIAGFSELSGELPHKSVGLVVFCLVGGILTLVVSFSLVINALKRLSDVDTPVFYMTYKRLRIRQFDIDWSTINSLTVRWVSNGKTSFAYMLMELDKSISIPGGDITESMGSRFYQAHKKQLSVGQNTLAVPLDRLDKASYDIAILIKRYWSHATGRVYQPESVELLYPQKKFSDFAQRTNPEPD